MFACDGSTLGIALSCGCRVNSSCVLCVCVCVCVFVCLFVCLRLLCLVCSMIPLVFLQVLEPFCPLSEQENLEPEELEVIQPTCSNTMFIIAQTELNSRPLPSDSSTHKDLSYTASLTEIETAIASPSLLDAESVVVVPPSLSGCTSAPQLCLVSAPPLSNSPSDSHLGALSAENDSCIPPQTKSDPPNF